MFMKVTSYMLPKGLPQVPVINQSVVCRSSETLGWCSVFLVVQYLIFKKFFSSFYSSSEAEKTYSDLMFADKMGMGFTLACVSLLGY